MDPRKKMWQMDDVIACLFGFQAGSFRLNWLIWQDIDQNYRSDNQEDVCSIGRYCTLVG